MLSHLGADSSFWENSADPLTQLGMDDWMSGTQLLGRSEGWSLALNTCPLPSPAALLLREAPPDRSASEFPALAGRTAQWKYQRG